MPTDHGSLANSADEQIAAFAQLEAYAERTPHPSATPDEVAEHLRTLTIAYHEIDHSWPAAARSAIEQVERERQEALTAPLARPKKASSWRERIAGIVSGALAGAIGCSLACVHDTGRLESWVFPFGLAFGALGAMRTCRRVGGIVTAALRGVLAFEIGVAGVYLYLALHDGFWAGSGPYMLRAVARFAAIGAVSGVSAFIGTQLVRMRGRVRA